MFFNILGHVLCIFSLFMIIKYLRMPYFLSQNKDYKWTYYDSFRTICIATITHMIPLYIDCKDYKISVASGVFLFVFSVILNICMFDIWNKQNGFGIPVDKE